ncbi:MAG TPA: LytTR family DNA-binding domain-containing protein [Chitinophagales bacterium]|nr:LytTR family DNA-binding domain-containing protein [Chitinophagales bacterium]
MLKAIIIDDEHYSIEALDLLLKKNCSNQVDVVAKCTLPVEGMKAIAQYKPDLLFLDVEMPVMSGFDLLTSLETNGFQVIFTTAHSEYALKAIKFSALDFLLKPIDKDQLMEAVNKAEEASKEKQELHQYHLFLHNLKNDESGFKTIVLPGSSGKVFLRVDEIVRCEAESNYTIFYTANHQRVIASKTLKEFEELLSEFHFIRIHHSHLINLYHIRKYIKGYGGGKVLMMDNSTIEISRRKRDAFLQAYKATS